MRILLLEDEVALGKGISLKLEREGYEVTWVETVEQSMALLDTPFDLAIADVGLPDGSGLTVCQALRQRQPKCTILLLTALDTELDMVTGYDMGADDYMTKPFALSVLLSKIRAVARRLEAVQGETDVLSPVDRSLTRNEMRLLAAFRNHPGQVLTKEQLLHVLWDVEGDFVDENTLAVNVQRLRRKIEKDPKHPRQILTVRGLGYRYVQYEA